MQQKWIIQSPSFTWERWAQIVQKIKQSITECKLQFRTNGWNDVLLIIDANHRGSIKLILDSIVDFICQIYPYPSDLGDSNFDLCKDVPQSLVDML